MRALEIASGVRDRQDHHEDECRDRYVDIRDTLKSLFSKIDGFHTLFLTIAGSIIALLVAGFAVTLWYVITHGAH